MLLKTGCLSLLIAMIASCGTGDNATISATPATLTSIEVTPANRSIAPGTAIQFMAVGTYSNSMKQNLSSSATWSASNTGIATVNNQGLATASATSGSTIISASFGGVTGSTTLTTSPVTTITVSPTSAPSIAPGTTRQFAAWGTLANGAVQELTVWVTWASSNTSVATIGMHSGLATAGAATGSTTISASFGGVSGLGSLTTSAVSMITVSPAGTTSIPKGMKQQFAAAGSLVDGTMQDLTTWATWSSSNTGVATISNAAGSQGLATSVNVGSTTISASFSGVTSSPAATLAVTPAVVTSIAVSPVNASIALGTTHQFVATGTFSDGTIKDISSSVIWSSSDMAVAIISNVTGSQGIATSLKEGTTTIRASMSGVMSNSAVLSVTPAVLVSLAVSPTSASIYIGGTQSFTATGIFSDGGTQDLTSSATWHSSNTAIATFSIVPGFEGVAIASDYSIGSVDITATVSEITSNTATLTVTYY